MNKPTPNAASLLSAGFWATPELHRQRMTTKEWRTVLLDGADEVFIHGHLRQLVAKNLGAGVVEVSVAPLREAAEKRGEEKP